VGMFDSFRDDKGGEWQTKAMGRNLDSFRVGEPVPGPPLDYQMEVIGGPRDRQVGDWTFVTIRDGMLAEVPAERDESLALWLYSGGWTRGRTSADAGAE
jgi:hypothetical protein